MHQDDDRKAYTCLYETPGWGNTSSIGIPLPEVVFLQMLGFGNSKHKLNPKLNLMIIILVGCAVQAKINTCRVHVKNDDNHQNKKHVQFAIIIKIWVRITCALSCYEPKSVKIRFQLFGFCRSFFGWRPCRNLLLVNPI